MKTNLRFFKHQFFKNIPVFIFMLIVLASMDTFDFFRVIPLHYITASIFVTLYFLDYQYNRNLINYYYSAPIKRNHLFWINLLCGFSYIVLAFTIIKIIFLFVPISHTYYASAAYDYIYNVIPLIIIHTLISAYVTTLTNSRVDSIILACLYPLFIYIGYSSLVHLPSTLLYGFPAINLNVIFANLFLVYIDFNNTYFIIQYLISFVIQFIFLMFLIRHGNKKRKIEDAHKPILEKRLFKIKMFSVYSLFLLILMLFGLSNSYIKLKYDFYQIFSFLVRFLESNALMFILGLAIYLVGSFTAKRKIENTIKYIFEYILLLGSFLIVLSVVVLVKSPLYEEVISDSASSATIIFDDYFDSVYVKMPEIIDLKTNNPVTFEFKESVDIIQEIHKTAIENRNNDESSYYFTIKYNNKQSRTYLANSSIHNLLKKLHGLNSELHQKLTAILEREKIISIEVEKEKINVDSKIKKDKINDFIKLGLSNIEVPTSGTLIYTTNYLIRLPNYFSTAQLNEFLDRR